MNLRVAAPVLVFGLLALHALHLIERVDGAYVFCRHAKNQTVGHGSVFNAGERVEGSSNSPGVVLLAAVRIPGAEIPEASRVLRLLFSLAIILLAAEATSKIPPSAQTSGIPAAPILAASPVAAMWAGGRMDAPLLSLRAVAIAPIHPTRRSLERLRP